MIEFWRSIKLYAHHKTMMDCENIQGNFYNQNRQIASIVRFKENDNSNSQIQIHNKKGQISISKTINSKVNFSHQKYQNLFKTFSRNILGNTRSQLLIYFPNEQKNFHKKLIIKIGGKIFFNRIIGN